MEKICEYAHVSKLQLIKILKWFTEYSDQELYSNRRNFWHFSDYCVLDISKTNKVGYLKETPEVVHIFQV